MLTQIFSQTFQESQAETGCSDHHTESEFVEETLPVGIDTTMNLDPVDSAMAHPLSNAFDQSEVFSAAIPALTEVDALGDENGTEFDGSGEGVEWRWRGSLDG